MVYAGFWRRFGAYLIDTIILAIAQWMLLAVVGGIGMLETEGTASIVTGLELGVSLVTLMGGMLYFALLESGSMQASLGKKALGMIVTDTNGQRISFSRAIGRYLGKIVSAAILLIGFIMAAFTDRKQALHDMMAGTLVVIGSPGGVGADPEIFS